MRQAGILAAAGLIALQEMVNFLSEDHRRAKMLAHGLADIPGIHLRSVEPQTNMVFFDLDSSLELTSKELISRLNDMGILIGVAGKNGFRLVTHFGIDDQAISMVINAIKEIIINQ